MLRVKELKTANGFRLIALDAPGKYSAGIETFVQIGSKYELEKEQGMSHFIEHMAFKGTKKRPKPIDLIRELDGKGVYYNASTGYESTSYYIRCLPAQLEWAGGVLNDILLNSTFDQEELEKERGVILEEIAMYNDSPSEGLSSDFFEKMVNSKYGCWNIIGKESILKEVNSQKLLDFNRQYFDPKRCICVVVVDFEKVKDLEGVLEKIAEEWSRLDSKSVDLPILDAKLEKFENKTTKDLEQAHFCLGWEGVSRNDATRYASRLVEMLLCGNFSSRLVSLLREELGVAYYVQPIGENLKEFGVMGVQAGVKLSKAQEVLERTKEEVAGLASWTSPEALERAKEYLIGNTLLSMDKISFWSDFIGQGYLLDGQVRDLEVELAKYRAVTLEEIQSFCNLRLKVENMSSLLLSK